jgi:hypothetical protein
MSKEIEDNALDRAAGEMDQTIAARKKEKQLTQGERLTSVIVGCGTLLVLAAIVPLLMMLWKAALR